MSDRPRILGDQPLSPRKKQWKTEAEDEGSCKREVFQRYITYCSIIYSTGLYNCIALYRVLLDGRYNQKGSDSTWESE